MAGMNFAELSSSRVAFGLDLMDTIYMLFSKRFSICLLFCVLYSSPLCLFGQILKKSDTLERALFRNQAPPSKETMVKLGLQAHWDDSGGNQNPSGLHLRFVKIGEEAAAGGRVAVRYRVLAEGAPENKVFAFGTWMLGKELTFDSRDVYVNGQGLLMIHKPKPEQELVTEAGDDEFDIKTVTDTGEPLRYLFERKDGQLRIYGTLIPHPLEAEELGCKLEVLLAKLDATEVLLVVEGFPASEKIPLVLESDGEGASEMMTTNANGHAVMAVFPFSRTKTLGTLKASAEGPGCLPTIVMPWGAASSAAAPASTPPEEKPAVKGHGKNIKSKLGRYL